MDILLIILGVICLITAILGTVLPVLPGPPIAYVGMILFHLTGRIQFTPTQLIVWAVLVVLVQVLDYVIPMLGSKYAGGTKWGSWGCVIGTVVGLFFSPWGIVLGPFLGAVAGELLGDKDLKYALKSGLGSLLGFLFGTIVKLMLCGYFIWQFIAAF
ncbi:DUF456 domain-containing protein [Bacteroides sp. ET225]|uniref:DUF456 domain-containing protein n=1 Tax=Bacteroides sp. ET225 TaxID=2972461 RepID=UPI001E1A7448|nr:DUF456 domain-containing protein [Bacteroides sp. ET225]MBW9200123.1 DUF456 domain-containing protein [Bacteroidales bacterium SW299]MCR8917896.1 DUF456 domain-containing protein [Bacteroides sp. ET225]